MESQSRRHTSCLCLRREKRIIPSPSFECTTVQIPSLYSSFQSIDYSFPTVSQYSILDADHQSMTDSNPLIPYQRIHSIVAFSPLPSSPLINGRLSSFLSDNISPSPSFTYSSPTSFLHSLMILPSFLYKFPGISSADSVEEEETVEWEEWDGKGRRKEGEMEGEATNEGWRLIHFKSS